VIDDNILNISVIAQLLKLEDIESVGLQSTMSLLDKLASLNGLMWSFLTWKCPTTMALKFSKSSNLILSLCMCPLLLAQTAIIPCPRKGVLNCPAPCQHDRSALAKADQ
jgi:hypothetical protein